MKPARKYWHLLISGLIVIGCLAFGGLARAADPPPTLDEYWQKVEQAQALLASLEDESPEVRRPQVMALASQWERLTQVALPDGTLVAVDHRFLVAQLRTNPPDLVRLQELLTTLLATHRTWPQPQHTSSDLKSLEAILARPEFQWPPEQPSPLTIWWQQVWEYFWDFFARFLSDQTLITLEGSLLQYLLTGLGSLLLIVVLAFALREVLAAFVAQAEVDPEAEPGEEVLTAETAFKRAQSLSGTGDYRTAVRYLYLSSLLLLDERGLLRYDRSQTNREYLRTVAHLPQLAAILREVIEVFDRVWYGYQALDEATYAQYAARVAELRRQK